MNAEKYGYTPSGMAIDDLEPGNRYQLSVFTGPDIEGEFVRLDSARRQTLFVVLKMAGGRIKRLQRRHITVIRST